MEFLPRTMGTRPRVAVEVRPEGVVAGRAEGSAGVLAAVARGELREGTMSPGLRSGNIVDRMAVSGAIRRALDGVSAKGGERSRYVTLVVPDAAARVLLLDFDALPGKAAEALAVVRFRLKKLLPFDAEHAVVSYQVMSSGRDAVRVLAVAMPCEVLAEYEGLVTEAGYLAGSVLPSTLAALGGLDGGDAGTEATLVVNAGPGSVTTTIVQGGSLLLHRTVDLGTGGGYERNEAMTGGAALSDGALSDGALRTGEVVGGARLPLVDRESSAGEWARQEPAGYERTGDGAAAGGAERDGLDFDRMDAETVMQAEVLRREMVPVPGAPDEVVRTLNEGEAVSSGREVTQAVSVAAAYFEDTLGGAPPVVVSAGTMGAERLRTVLVTYGMEGLRVREMVDAEAIGLSASTSTVPRGWLAGVRGALRS